jgi:uncharacterized membrane protein YqgA involved in biofilm formation
MVMTCTSVKGAVIANILNLEAQIKAAEEQANEEPEEVEA